jgi:hypothetical protein
MAIDWDDVVLGPVMATFGEDERTGPPVYTPRGLPAFELADAVFDAQYEHVEAAPDDGAASSTRRPVLGVRLSLFKRPPAASDRVMIPSTGKGYVVKDVQPDGHGHALLILMERAS